MYLGFILLNTLFNCVCDQFLNHFASTLVLLYKDSLISVPFSLYQILMMAACIMLFCNMRDKSKY